jgi:hypothetical protein
VLVAKAHYSSATCRPDGNWLRSYMQEFVQHVQFATVLHKRLRYDLIAIVIARPLEQIRVAAALAQLHQLVLK